MAVEMNLIFETWGSCRENADLGLQQQIMSEVLDVPVHYHELQRIVSLARMSGGVKVRMSDEQFTKFIIGRYKRGFVNRIRMLEPVYVPNDKDIKIIDLRESLK